MRLTDEQVEQFRALVEAEFGEPMSLDEARIEAESFLNILLLISRKRPTSRGSAID